ncbi:MAG: HAD family hydrolase [Bryobacteraceae bacterium]|jgi:D-glycero-D-manno-heptose 1,7-bisphosphate phosphatase
MSPRPAVFFDRDGTLMEEVGYCADPRQVRLYPGVPLALRELKAAGFLTFIVTNQSGIARGFFTEAQYRAVQAQLLAEIGPGLIDASYFCPDAPGVPSSCRKPEPGMLLQAARDFAIDLPRSYFIGDKSADIECGRRAGTRTILVMTGYGSLETCTPDWRAPDVAQAIRLVLDQAP